MAEGLLRHDAGNRFEVASAGVEPSRVRQEAIAIEVMQEIGIDISEHRSKSVDEFAEEEFDYVITVCDNANDVARSFPVIPSGSIGALTIQPPPKVTRTENLLSCAGFVTRYDIVCDSLPMLLIDDPSYSAYGLTAISQFTEPPPPIV